MTPTTAFPKCRATRRFVVALLCLVAAATWIAFHPVTVNAISGCVQDCEYYCASAGGWCGGVLQWFTFEGGEEVCEWWCGA